MHLHVRPKYGLLGYLHLIILAMFVVLLDFNLRDCARTVHIMLARGLAVCQVCAFVSVCVCVCVYVCLCLC